MKRYLLVFVLLLIGFIGRAQVSLTGELRPRTEYSHGYGTLANASQDASIITTQRTRINLGYNNELLTSKVVLQDVRLWGWQAQLVSNEDFAVSVHEAWAEAKLFGNWFVKAGRQELVYDDHRILGSVGWAQQARSHDIAVLKFKSEIEAHIGLALNQNSNRTNNLFDGANAYKAMQFLWANKKIDDLSISILALNNGVAFNENGAQNIVYSQTLGTHVKYKMSEELNFAFNAYYQGGNVVFKDAKTTLSAYNVLAEANYKPGKIAFSLGYELLSGNDAGDNSKLQSFTPLYGTNHKFNGHMDYFYAGNHMNSVGLHDLYVKGAFNIKKGKAAVHLHSFSSATNIGSETAGLLGVELDCSYAYNLSEMTQLSIGYSQIYATEKMEELKGGIANQMHNWAYLMFTFKPSFLN